MTWLIAAYTIVWIAIFVYVFSVDRKQKSLAGELEQLKSKLGN
jgi:CcmD family protein